MMKALRILPIVTVLMLVSCGGEDETEYNEKEEQAPVPTEDYDELSQELADLEKAIEANPKDEESRKRVVTRMQDFVDFFPEDPKSPDFLFKASDHALQVNQSTKSVKLLERLQKEYPDYDKMIDVDYNRASHLDWEIRDTTRAKEAYQFFIDKYPNDNRSKDAAIRIKYIRYGWKEYTEMVFNGEIEPIEPDLP